MIPIYFIITMSGNDAHLTERQSLLTRLLDAVKQCQVRFGGKKELATDLDSRVSCLCAGWEAVFQHGMRYNSKALLALKQVSEITGLSKVAMFGEIRNMETQPAFWQYVREHLTKHEVQRFLILKKINMDMGRGRAWLRACLNEHSLERYIHMLIERDDILSQYYEEWSFLRDQERNSMLPMMAAGLGSILFAVTVDSADLDAVRSNPVVPSLSPSLPLLPFDKPQDDIQPVLAERQTKNEKRREKKKKKKLPNIVTFTEDDDLDSVSSSPASLHNVSFDMLSKATEQQETKSSLEFVNGLQVVTTEMSDVSVCVSDSTKGQEPSADSDKHETTKKELLRSMNSQASLLSELSLSDEGYLGPTFQTPMNRRASQESESSTENDGNSPNQLFIPVKPNEFTTGTTLTCSSQPINAHSHPAEKTAPMDVGGYSAPNVESTAFALAIVQRGNTDSERTQGDGGNVQEENKQEMTTNELKQAIVAMMLRKDEVEEQNRTLQCTLAHELEVSSALRAEAEEIKSKMTIIQDSNNAKIQALQKENELLRHQLKKYVNAVQLLRREGSKAEGLLGIHLDDLQPTIPPPKENIDYSHEAAEYERKLIQVAEMHGELLEFNDILHRQINAKDSLIRKLRQELVNLRGPLPLNMPTAETELPENMDCMSVQNRNLVHIWIPSAFLRGRSSDSYHVYQVYTRIKDEEWNVYRRYRQFYLFHNKLKKSYPIVSRYNFPPKVTVGHKDSRLVEKRRLLLQSYLRLVINYITEQTEDLEANLTRETLIGILPFLGEQPAEESGKNPSRPTITGLSNEQRGSGAAQNQAHYSGL